MNYERGKRIPGNPKEAQLGITPPSSSRDLLFTFTEKVYNIELTIFEMTFEGERVMSGFINPFY